MKLFVFVFFIFLSANVFGQVENDLRTLAETEKSFARLATEKGTKSAFLEFTAPDGIMFSPNAVNAKEYWNARDESKALLFWQPSYVDISSNGMLGWTTGPWELRPNGKDDKPSAFGQFLTVWQKQPDGKYRFVLDIGISHAETQVTGVDWKSPSDAGREMNSRRISAGDSSNGFFQMVGQNNPAKAYKAYAAEDIRVLREGRMPIIGRDAFLSELKKNKASVAFAKRSVFFGAADLAYVASTYTMTRADNTTEKGNYVQIWKMRGGKWQIVLDLLSPIPEEKK